MRLSKWIGLGAAIGVAGLLATPGVQSALKARAFKGRIDPLATSDVPPSREIAAGVDLPDGIRERLANADGTVNVMVELQDPPAAVAFGEARALAPLGTSAVQVDAAAVTAARGRVAAIESAQQGVMAGLSGVRAQVLYRVQRAYNGISVRVDARQLAALRALPGVKAVHRIVPKHLQNWNSVPFIGAPTVWTSGLGYTGNGVKVGVIDTGVDYLHSNFGGPGAGADYRGLDPGNPATYDVFTAAGHDNYPGVKVAGGHDFVGDAYNGSNTPVPDDDPMDCNGHGSHVAGTIAGYGVNGDGSQYTGAYGSGTPFASLKIGPGVAPDATLYALRVFGCGGSTGVVTEAIDWAIDPNGDGDPSDHLDVINMSLGSSFGEPDDPDAVASDNAALAGVIVAAASGNSGDTYYVTSSPASSARALSVAASLDKAAVVSGLVVNAPAALAGVKAASEAVFPPDLAVTGDVTGDLVVTNPVNGCGAIATALSGKIALIDRGTCSFKTKVIDAQNAGATGVVITNNVTGFPVTMGDDPTVPNPTIPVMMTDKTNGDAIRASIGGGATVNVTLTAAYREKSKSIQPQLEDTIASFSSRGPSRVGNALKPDIDSIGETVFSTQALSGTEGDSFNGTSMATPHIAGTMALLRQIHPGWSVAELKALVMNNASHDIFALTSGVLPLDGPGRVGAGREDVARAAAGQVIAYSAKNDGRVSVSFGSLQVAAATTLTRSIKVTNKGTSAATFAVAFDGTNRPAIPGVAFTTSTSSISVGNGKTAKFDVTLTADPAAMKHSRDASVGNTQATPFGTLSRHFLSEAAGYVTLTPATGPVLRVPVYATARPISNMTTVETSLNITSGGNTGSQTLTLAGTPVNTGASFGIASPFPGQDEISLVSVFELQEKSPRLPFVPGQPPRQDDDADLRYVGVAKTADALGPVVNFGIATWGEFQTANPYDVEFDIYIDTDRDGTDDYALFNWNLGSAGGGNPADVFYSVLVNLKTDPPVLVAERRINGISPGTRDTVGFNTSVMSISAYAADLGITGAFDWHVLSFNRAVGFVDESPTQPSDPGDPPRRFTWNFATPGISAPGAGGAYAGAPTYEDLNGNVINVSYDRNAFIAAGSKGVLLLHHHNGFANRAQAVNVKAKKFGG
jgi:subtilisin family serine protease